VAKAGFKNIICFSGNRRGLSDEDGIKNCAIGLRRIAPICEKHNVVAVMELLNSKVNHKDYQCDHTPWGVECAKRSARNISNCSTTSTTCRLWRATSSPRSRRATNTSRTTTPAAFLARNEIDDTQEIHYPAVMQAIVATGYKGFVAQEFIPKRPDVIASLKQGVQICDV
jgi:hydroxypyruvate isomerase